MSRVLICLAALSLGACSTMGDPPASEPIRDACPPSATAALESRPSEVAVTADEQLGLDVAGIRILGADRFAGMSLSEAQQDARTRRLETRIEQTRVWCEARRQP